MNKNREPWKGCVFKPTAGRHVVLLLQPTSWYVDFGCHVLLITPRFSSCFKTTRAGAWRNKTWSNNKCFAKVTWLVGLPLAWGPSGQSCDAGSTPRWQPPWWGHWGRGSWCLKNTVGKLCWKGECPEMETGWLAAEQSQPMAAPLCTSTKPSRGSHRDIFLPGEAKRNKENRWLIWTYKQGLHPGMLNMDKQKAQQAEEESPLIFVEQKPQNHSLHGEVVAPLVRRVGRSGPRTWLPLKIHAHFRSFARDVELCVLGGDRCAPHQGRMYTWIISSKHGHPLPYQEGHQLPPWPVLSLPFSRLGVLAWTFVEGATPASHINPSSPQKPQVLELP